MGVDGNWFDRYPPEGGASRETIVRRWESLEIGRVLKTSLAEILGWFLFKVGEWELFLMRTLG